ncbi:DUF922 domain-containing protein [Mucilaginibacter ginkgonis]|uniref:DUF922 domain-containing protein n=1 Tax=Mucilaginibacter ginkgonis TaxID=2682091 RepID=A0A6I4HY06_9SPHI|nr:DUF922 domain-containing protein [Mucilaginibacter ginkgonis]QQL49557.1 DUF922 domain-containing protein [Mucilaginibacter ginkgonis]
MTLRFVRVICVIAVVFFAGLRSVNAQAYRQLSSFDFKGTPMPGGYIAYTNCSIDYTYQPVWMDGYYKLKINVNVQVNKNRSWIDRSRVNNPEMLAEVLKHEQGHYIFAYMMQQEMMDAGNKMRFGNDYDKQVSLVLNRIKNKYKQLNDDYDDDTEHMTNHVQQKSWDMYFRQSLGNRYANVVTVSQAR